MNSAAHAALGNSVQRLRQDATEAYRLAAVHGVGDEMWAGGDELRLGIAQSSAGGDSRAAAARAVAEARLRWVDAQLDFVDELAEVTDVAGIRRW